MEKKLIRYKHGEEDVTYEGGVFRKPNGDTLSPEEVILELCEIIEEVDKDNVFVDSEELINAFSDYMKGVRK